MPSWSSPNPISRYDSSMPADCTPRISPTFSTVFRPGMWLPGGANTVFSPALAFGAPHTTLTRPSPVSTVQTRKRSAFGCCTASTISATRKAASAAPVSSTPSSSSPIRVSASVMAASGSLVSRCVLSQDSVNFMAPRPRARPRGRAG